VRRIITYRTASGGVVRRTLLLSGQDIQALNAMCRRNEGFGEQIIPSKPGACASSFLHSYSSRARATVVEDQGCTGRQAGRQAQGLGLLGPLCVPTLSAVVSGSRLLRSQTALSSPYPDAIFTPTC
jgi:hypothetical protein